MTHRTNILLRLLFLSIGLLVALESHAAEWQISGTSKLKINEGTTITLQKSGEGKKSGRIWLEARPVDSVLTAEVVDYNNDQARVTVFIRSKAEDLVIFDEADNTSTAIPLKSIISKRLPDVDHQPEFQLEMPKAMPLAFANQGVTVTLVASTSSKFQGESIYISASDQRARKVFGKFFSKFDLLSGQSKITIPSAGDFQVDIAWYKEPVTSMPVSSIRQPISIPFGLDIQKVNEALVQEDSVTTSMVMGSLVAVENVPSTATLLGRDRIRLPVFAGQSNENRLNRWPFAVNANANNKIGLPILQKLLLLESGIGASFSPIAILWSDIQKGPGGFSWEKLSLYLKLYRGNRVRPLLSIPGKAAWNGADKAASTEQLDAWTSLTRKIGEQFRPYIWGLHVWDYGSFWPEGAEKERYRNLIDSTWNGFMVDATGKVHSGPPIIIGGGVGFNREFFKDMLTSKTVEQVGGLAYSMHRPGRAFEFNELQAELVEAGNFASELPNERIRMYLNDLTWESGPGSLSSKDQANYLVRAYSLALAHGFYKVIWKSLLDDAISSSGLSVGEGLFTRNLTPKPSAVAFNLTAYMLSGAGNGKVTKSGDVTICKFDISRQDNKWPGNVYVLWNENRSKLQQVEINVEMVGGIFAQDYLGSEIPMIINKSSVTVPIGFEPIFVWDAGGPPQVTKRQNDNNIK